MRLFSRILLVALAVVRTASSSHISLGKRLLGCVVEAGDPVVIDSTGEYIRVSFMNDSSLLGGYVGRDGSQNVLRAVWSTNGGQSWNYPGEVFRGELATHDINNAIPLQLLNGRIIYAPQWQACRRTAVYDAWGTLAASFVTNEDVDGTNGYDGAQVKVITSVDGGRTWSSSVVTGEAASHWPGTFNHDATHILALYSKDGLGVVNQLYELQN
ncbi:hypothetical protein AAE478_006515 [Parahypoxylon ruwenzoriense]